MKPTRKPHDKYFKGIHFGELTFAKLFVGFLVMYYKYFTAQNYERMCLALKLLSIKCTKYEAHSAFIVIYLRKNFNK